MAKSLRKNYIYNVLLNLSSVIFPMITAPYVARVLEPDGVGLCNFANMYAHYFALFALLGIPNYGIREVSKLRNNKSELTLIVSQLISISLVTTFIISVVYVISVFTINQLYENYILFIVAGFSIYMVPLKVNWYYQGMEDFGFITFRSLIIRLISIICLFIFVHEKDDLIIYIVLNVLGSISADVWNFLKMKQSGICPNITTSGLKKHIKPLWYLFASSIAISVYAVLDTIMLGFIKDYTEVGYYNNASHISKIFLSLVCSFSTVSIPRFAYYIKDKQQDMANDLFNKSFSLLFFLSFPISIGISCISPIFVPWFFGAQFYGAIVPTMILAFLNISIGMSNLVGLQVMIGIGLDKLFLKAIFIGAIVNFTLNIFLIPQYGAIGASMASVLAESAVTTAMLYYIYKFTFIRIRVKSDIIKSFGGALLFIPLAYIIPQSIPTTTHILLFILLCSFTYLSAQWILKNHTFLLFQDSLILFVKKKHSYK